MYILSLFKKRVPSKINMQLDWYYEYRKQRNLYKGDESIYLEQFISIIKTNNAEDVTFRDIEQYYHSIKDKLTMYQIISRMKVLRGFFKFCRLIKLKCIDPGYIGDFGPMGSYPQENYEGYTQGVK